MIKSSNNMLEGKGYNSEADEPEFLTTNMGKDLGEATIFHIPLVRNEPTVRDRTYLIKAQPRKGAKTGYFVAHFPYISYDYLPLDPVKEADQTALRMGAFSNDEYSFCEHVDFCSGDQETGIVELPREDKTVHFYLYLKYKTGINDLVQQRRVYLHPEDKPEVIEAIQKLNRCTT